MNNPQIFVSYRRHRGKDIAPYVEAMKAAGLKVWVDTQQVEKLDDFSAEIAAALAESSALLVWYSADYLESIPCQWELTAAFIAALRSGHPMRRILVANPEASAEHVILPSELNSQDHLNPSAISPEAFAATVKDKVAKLADVFGAVRPDTPTRWHPHAPPGAPRFVGRYQDMWQLQCLLLEGSDVSIKAEGPALRAWLWGMGGMGKTLLAEQYALRFGWAYPGGIFWLRAYGGDKTGEGLELESLRPELLTQLISLAEELGLQVDGLDLPQIRGLLASVLEKEKPHKPFLWVVDDLPPGVTVEDIGEWSAPTTLGKTLITTRSEEYRNLDKQLRLSGLPEAAALELLTSRRKPQNETEQAAAGRLMAMLGNHPLALEIAAAALEDSISPAPYEEFLEDLESPEDDALEAAKEFAGTLPSGHETSITNTVLRSIRLLGDEARDVLLLASQLAAGPIPVKLIQGTFLAADGGEDRTARKRIQKGIAEAERHSLAQFNREGLTLTVHPLVTRTLRYRGEYAERRDGLRQASILVLNKTLEPVTDIRTHKELEKEVLHARALIATIANDNDANLLGWVARHDYERGDYRSAKTFLERQRDVLSSLHGEEWPETLTAMSNLAQTLQSQGNLPDARALQEKTLDITRRVFGEEHPDTLTYMNNLASTLKDQGDLPGARALQEKTLDIRRQALGEEHPDTLTSMNNLALTLQSQGELLAAWVLQEKTLDIRRQVLGEEHPDTLASMNNLASTLLEQGDLPSSQTLQEKVLAICRRVLGEEHPNTLTSMNNLAQTLQEQGDLPSARALQEKTLDIRRRVLGEEHPRTLTSMNNLAATLQVQGDLPAAREMMEKTLGIRRQVLGREHPDTTISAFNLFATLAGMKEHEASQKIFHDELTWLLECDPSALSAGQLNIRKQLLEFMQPDSEPNEGNADP